VSSIQNWRLVMSLNMNAIPVSCGKNLEPFKPLSLSSMLSTTYKNIFLSDILQLIVLKLSVLLGTNIHPKIQKNVMKTRIHR